MNLRKDFLIIELTLILLYILITLFSIIIQPINIILGIICVLFLPGYNLLYILTPKFNLIKKLGYMTLLSLTIENIFMLFYYFLIYNFVEFDPKNPYEAGLIFNKYCLIIAIQIINIVLILINELFVFKHRESDDFRIQKRIFSVLFKYIKDKFNIKNVLILIGFVYSLFLLCISSLYNDVLKNNYESNLTAYNANFTFFIRVPFAFYIFLAITIFCLIYLIFRFKNHYIILISISAFIYCLSILPYLQIKNYFSTDTYYLFLLYKNYEVEGISHLGKNGFCVLPTMGSQRNSTNLFTAIILTTATYVDINFALWYLYPLIYIFLPFFFYSIFQKFLIREEKNDFNVLIITLIMILTPQILNSEHNINTGLIGIIVFFLIVVEFYNLFHKSKIKITDCILIIILYFFLCLSRLEECIYTIFLLILYGIYFVFVNIRELEINKIIRQQMEHSSKNKSPRTFHINYRNNLNKNIAFIGFFLFILSIIFYLTIDFFGYTTHFFLMTFGKISYFGFIFNSYNYFQNFFIGFLFIAVILYVLVLRLLLFNFFNFFYKLCNIGIKVLRNFCRLINKQFARKIIQIILFPLFFFIIILLYYFILRGYREYFLFTIIALIIVYANSIFHLFAFLKGINYYNLENKTQNYFLLAILASSIVIVLLLFIVLFGILNYLWFMLYILHYKFLVYLIFFNLIIIQNTYFKDYIREMKKGVVILIIVFFFIGIFGSLRGLRFG